MEKITLNRDFNHPKLGLITAGTTITCDDKVAEMIRLNESTPADEEE